MSHDDDATRLLPSPFAGQGEGQVFDSCADDAKTPCVGVESMGVTRFGETDTGLGTVVPISEVFEERAAATERRRPARPSERSSGHRRRERPEAARSEGRHAQVAEPGSFVPPTIFAAVISRPVVGWFGRVPPWVSAFVGGVIGLFGALWFVNAGASSGDPEPNRAGVSSQLATLGGEGGVEVVVRITTDEGLPLPGVFARAGQKRSVTDEEGRATLTLERAGRFTVEATCPEGTMGEPLGRALSPALLGASDSLSFDLICTPEFVEQSIEVTTDGCGEMRVGLDGVHVGTTEAGRLVHTRRVAPTSRGVQSGIVQIAVEPVEGKCKLEKSFIEMPFERSSPDVGAHFSGKRPPRPRSGSPRPLFVHERVRPYRL